MKGEISKRLVEFGLIAVGFDDSGLQIIRYYRSRYALQAGKRLGKTMKKVFRALTHHGYHERKLAATRNRYKHGYWPQFSRQRVSQIQGMPGKVNKGACPS